MKKSIGVLGLGLLLGFIANGASAASIDCELRFNMSGWSAFYKTASGSGTISCNNGHSLKVNIRAKGGGLTFGKQRINDGRGKFSEVHNIKDLLGTYASGGAHAGAIKSSAASVVTKGDVSLALAGTGEGIDIGIDFGKFVISRR
ncbi:hypothetical protein DFR29_11817 [Tahibacter aquaticus]|uniref:Secreted protein n=1 Tax=Tahibacter aquaticus TaxID=520092 RepID=A0A4R6YMV0_9GAMM|nr:hypothetical protein [Tahibacter aquaticus]TDR38874.1 hypothetical protein DFR29_11817 [Tahibacter aquaticus]